MVSSTYLVALVALLGSTITSAHAHRNAAAEIRSRLEHRQNEVGPKGSLNGPAIGCYELPDSYKQPTGNWLNPATGKEEPAAYSTFMTASRCGGSCAALKKEAIAVSSSECYCGSLLPKKSMQVDDNKCNKDCQGWDKVKCK